MSKRPFDHIENKIREAAEHSEPPFNEHAWEKMELLLDKEKRKRRFLIWWRLGLPMLLIGLSTGAYVLFGTGQPGGKTTVAATLKDPETQTTGSKQQKSSDNQTETEPAATNTAGQKPTPVAEPEDATTSGSKGPAPAGNSINSSKLSPAKSNVTLTNTDGNEPGASTASAGSKHLTDKKKAKKQSTKGSLLVNSSIDYGTDKVEVSSVAAEPTENKTITKEADLIVGTNNSNTKITAPTPKVIPANTQPDSSRKELQSVSKTVAKKDNKTTGGKFYVLAEGGAEILKTKFLSYGNSIVSGRYGVGIGYEISKRLSVQTGFYAGRKKYTGGPGDYHPKQGSYWSMVNLKSIDASCLVYDIPVTVKYNFSRPSAKFNWYGMAGLSSFIMKKEDYHYFYSYNSMPNMIHDKAYSYTGNKNLFSILTLSAGFERKLSTRTAIIAEPYLSLPLGGVGDGAVKLYSTGLQVGLKYHPKF